LERHAAFGRIIFEENVQEKFGSQVEPLSEGFQKAEKDIWQVTAKVLTPVQQHKLHALLDKWRMNNPGMVFFPSIQILLLGFIKPRTHNVMNHRKII
jgi:hypothetical protein